MSTVGSPHYGGILIVHLARSALWRNSFADTCGCGHNMPDNMLLMESVQ
jgi:hypothetical protein